MRGTKGYGVDRAGVAVRGFRWSVMSTRLGAPVAIVLSDEERETLERWARRPTTAQALALRSRIVLAAAAGPNTEIGAALGCHPVTAGKWRRRFAQRRLDGLSDEPRPGAPRTIGDEPVIVKTLEQQPRNATHWSTRSMAAEWACGGLQDLARLWPQTAPRGAAIDKVRDVARRGVLCVDEKTRSRRSHGADAADAAGRAPPSDPRLRASRRHQSLRGARYRLGPRDRRPDPATPGPRVPALPRPDCEQVDELAVHVVLDNVATHRTAEPALAPAPSPLQLSLHADLQLLDEPGRWFAELTTKWLRRGAPAAWLLTPNAGRRNADPRPFVWHKTADQIFVRRISQPD